MISFYEDSMSVKIPMNCTMFFVHESHVSRWKKRGRFSVLFCDDAVWSAAHRALNFHRPEVYFERFMKKSGCSCQTLECKNELKERTSLGSWYTLSKTHFISPLPHLAILYPLPLILNILKPPSSFFPFGEGSRHIHFKVLKIQPDSFVDFDKCCKISQNA